MISSAMVSRINVQIEREMFSAFLYLAFAQKMAEAGYKGVAKWFTIQYHEEMFHAMKFVEYLHDQGASPVIPAIQKPEVKVSGVKELFQASLAHEKTVTASIHEIMAQAIAEKDYATQALAQWYVNEQVEEEKNAVEILQTIDLLGDSKHGTFMLNIELGKRSLGVPANFTEIGGGH